MGTRGWLMKMHWIYCPIYIYIALFVRLIPDSVRFTPTSVCMFQLVGLKNLIIYMPWFTIVFLNTWDSLAPHWAEIWVRSLAPLITQDLWCHFRVPILVGYIPVASHGMSPSFCGLVPLELLPFWSKFIEQNIFGIPIFVWIFAPFLLVSIIS